MGILLNLTKEYFGEIERTEDELPMLERTPDGVQIHKFRDANGKIHKNGYYIPTGRKDVFYHLVSELIRLRGVGANLNDIDVSNIRDLNSVFGYEDFRGDVSGWDTSNVISMYRLFKRCNKFNCDLNNWDVSNVENFEEMFDGCETFNGNISNWKLSTEKDIQAEYMFRNCYKFNCDISKWNVSKITNPYGMFWGCHAFNRDLSNWEMTDGNAFINSKVDMKNLPKKIKVK